MCEVCETRDTNPSVEERVQRGIAVLDEKGPEDWREKIDLETLNIGSVTSCILGQIYGDYWVGRNALPIDVGYSYGFDSSAAHAEEVETEWKRVLAA